MTKTYAQLQKQIETLQREAEKVKRVERQGVIDRIKEAIAAYDITASDLGLGGGKGQRGTRATGRVAGKAARAKAGQAVRFRDSAGNTWVGRGPRPQWLREALANGKTLKDFAV